MKKYILVFLLCLLAIPVLAQRVSDLPAVQLPLTGNELMSLDQNGTSKRVTTSSLMLGSLVLGIPSGGTGLSSVGPVGTCLQSNGLSLLYGACGTGGGGSGGTGSSTNNQLLINNFNTVGGATIGSGLSLIGNTLVSTSTGAAAPSGMFPQIQINGGMGNFAPLSVDTAASYAAHDTIMNGIAYDPRNSGAICGGVNHFAGNGTTTAFTYTIPFTGSSSTDNTNFFVYIETDGFTPATILNTTQFTVTGVNTGVGGTITLNSAPANGSTLIVAHDDGPGFVAASISSSATGGHIEAPSGCSIYTSQSLGTQLAEGAQLIGQNFTPNYLGQDQGALPLIIVLAPTGAAPAAGFNISNKAQQFYEGFGMTTAIPGANPSFGFLSVPVAIGVVGNNGAGAGGSPSTGEDPGITVQYTSENSFQVAFGAPIGGNAKYIFSTLRFNNWISNTVGLYGPVSDSVVIGNVGGSNGIFGSLGAAGCMVFGPQQGAPGASSGNRVENNRCEFNREGIVFQSITNSSFVGNQFDRNSECGLDLRGYAQNNTFTDGWFKGNGNGGTPFQGNATAGQDAHICGNDTSGVNGLYFTNVGFSTNYIDGSIQPIGTNGATTPAYVLDITTTASLYQNIHLSDGYAFYQSGANGASVTDTFNFRTGIPPGFVVNNVAGQANQGTNSDGKLPSLSRGKPSNQFGAFYVFGDRNSNNNTLPSLSAGWVNIVGQKLGIDPTYFIQNNDSTAGCDLAWAQIVPNTTSLNLANNPLLAYLPSRNDVLFGAGSYQNHLSDSQSCQLGAVTLLATPRPYKTYAQSSNCTTTGSGWTNTSDASGLFGKQDSTNGDSISCTVTTEGNPLYLWYKMQGNNGGTFTWTLDSVTTGSVVVQGTNNIGFPVSTSNLSVGAVRIPAGTAGSHTLNLAITSTTSASNNVAFYGIGTAPGKEYDGSMPYVVLGGAIPNGPFPDAAAAYNNLYHTMSFLLQQDGLQISFADVNNYVNGNATEIQGWPSYPSIDAQGVGQLHLADAFEAKIQGSWNAGNVLNPLDYGAACNAQFYSPDNGGNSLVTTTSGSPTISINNYTWNPGMATQRGGGDVGKRVCIMAGWNGSQPGGQLSNDVGPCGCIVSVDTNANTANLSWNAWASNFEQHTNILFSGYPSNPNDPTTCQDDTPAFQIALNTAAKNVGTKVSVPQNCAIHDLIAQPNVWMEGNMAGNYYQQNTDVSNAASPAGATVLWVGNTTYPTDNQLGIDVSQAPMAKFSNILLHGIAFPVPSYKISGVGIGIGSSQGRLGPGAWVETDHMSYSSLPVSFGNAYGFNIPVTFTASIAASSATTALMTVTTISSNNFKTTYGLDFNTVNTNDYLSKGRSFTALGQTVTITSVPQGAQAGVYALQTTSTLNSTTTAITAAGESGNGIQWFDTDSQFIWNMIGASGALTDSHLKGTIFTGSFSQYGWYLGSPNTFDGVVTWDGGRAEEQSTGGFVCDNGIEVQINGVQFQFNGAADILAKDNCIGLNITGGLSESTANNHGKAATVVVANSANHINLQGLSANTCCGGTLNPVFLTATGWTGDYLSFDGQIFGNMPATTNFAGGGTPQHWSFKAPGFNTVDLTQSVLSITTTGGIGIGTAAAQAGMALDVSQFTTSIGLPTGCTRPTGIAGMIRFNPCTQFAEVFNGQTWASLTSASPGFINGFLISNDATTPNSVIDIANGTAVSDDGGTVISQPFNTTKTTGSWAVGSGNGCLANGSIAASTWYADYEIERVDTAVVDNLCSTSATTPVMPTNYTKKRLIGFFVTDSSSHILSYTITQKGTGVQRYAFTATPTLDLVTTSLSTTASTITLNVPQGVQVSPYLKVSMSNTNTAPTSVLFSSLDEADQPPTATNPFTAAPGYSLLVTSTPGTTANTSISGLMTSTAGTVRLRSSQAGTSVSIVNDGFEYCNGCSYQTIGNIAIDATTSSALVTTLTGSFTISTNATNETIYAMSACPDGATISAINDTTSMSWTHRTAYSPGTGAIDTYTANTGNNILSSDSVALSLTSSNSTVPCIFYGISIAGLNNTTPFDPNASLTAKTNNPFGFSYSTISTTFSTTKFRDLVISGQIDFHTQGQAAPTVSSGYTRLFPDVTYNANSGTFAIATSFGFLTAPVTGSTVVYTYSPLPSGRGLMTTDAFQASGQ